MHSTAVNQDNAGQHAIRAIAFHLPQFHPIPENDKWWGKGFTEWTNVVRAKSLFPGHDQPHLPGELGFYDLRLPETRAAQAELAAQSGIYGFCYFHYWFHGHQLLERPVNEILKTAEPDFPFCLCWANESWTRRWNGGDDEILIEQRYSAADDLEHIRALLPFFLDRRYVRVLDRPLFAIYRASKLPEPQRTTDLWRREAERAGLKGLFLVRVESFTDERADPRPLGFDLSVDFQPDWRVLRSRIARRKWWHRRKLRTAEPAFYDHVICEYADMVRQGLDEPSPGYPRIPCVCPRWDNSARREKGAIIMVNSTPELYECWLREIVNRQKTRMAVHSQSDLSPDSLVFINAWNEWAEGNHIEPCQKWGRAYMDATRRALSSSGSNAPQALRAHDGVCGIWWCTIASRVLTAYDHC